MSTLQEIQHAIEQLSELQRFELMDWMHRTYETIDPEDEAQLIAEAEIGERQLREGKGIPLEEVRKLTRTWIMKKSDA